MNILVCMKQVPDTAIAIRLDAEQKSIDRSEITYVVNPFDEYAIEAGLQLKEKYGGEVTLVTMGPDRADEALRTGLAMGADKGVHISDPALEGSDTLVTAKVLAAAIKGLPYDIVLCGKVATDDNTGQVGPALAELLGIPHISGATTLEVDDDAKKATATREVEGGFMRMEVPIPAVITAEKDLNAPRYPSLPGIMKAKTKPVDKKDVASLGMDPSSVGLAGSKIQPMGMSLPPVREAGRIIEGEAEEAAKELARLLRAEVKIL
ncbi:MAG: electron transfer flavoprotein subunit beta/FixA family protein [Thermoplasmata archaeon]|nr:electron transfer flavoprotein subunit beta/FixA family protein [Candidatus Thermoplasmatota archaeon]MCK4948757.1 electron transfer flavoprotein subunit beta/FixA family protein [Thermoplasmata archaeon]